MKKKPKQDDDYYEALSLILGVGSYHGFTAVLKEDKPKPRRQIGFIRSKPKKKK